MGHFTFLGRRNVKEFCARSWLCQLRAVPLRIWYFLKKLFLNAKMAEVLIGALVKRTIS